MMPVDTSIENPYKPIGGITYLDPLNPGMGSDPVVVANSLLATGVSIDPQPVSVIPPASAPLMTPLGAPRYVMANPDIVFARIPAPLAKGGGAPSTGVTTQANSAAYTTAIEATINPTIEEQPWGEDEVALGSPYSPGNGGPGWNTANDSALGSAEQLAENVVSGVVQGVQAVVNSQGYDGTTDAYPFSYGQSGYQGARNAYASTNGPSSSGGLLVLLLVLWVIFK